MPLNWTRRPELIGHSGISGAFAFYDAAKGQVYAGTTNQLANRQLPFRLLSELSA